MAFTLRIKLSGLCVFFPIRDSVGATNSNTVAVLVNAWQERFCHEAKLKLDVGLPASGPTLPFALTRHDITLFDGATEITRAPDGAANHSLTGYPRLLTIPDIRPLKQGVHGDDKALNQACAARVLLAGGTITPRRPTADYWQLESVTPLNQNGTVIPGSVQQITTEFVYERPCANDTLKLALRDPGVAQPTEIVVRPENVGGSRVVQVHLENMSPVSCEQPLQSDVRNGSEHFRLVYKLHHCEPPIPYWLRQRDVQTSGPSGPGEIHPCVGGCHGPYC